MAGVQPITASMDAAGGTVPANSGVRRNIIVLACVAAVAMVVGALLRRPGGLASFFPSINPLWLGVALLAVAALAVAAVLMRRRQAGAGVPAVEPATVPAAKIAKMTAARVEEPVLDRSVTPGPAADAADVAAGMAAIRGTIESSLEAADDMPQGPLLGEIGIEQAVEKIIKDGTTRAIFVSPEGDDGAAVAVLVAREIADAGLRVLALDLTGSGALSLPMLDSTSLPGVTDLLAGEAQFTEAVHEDNFSDCHVMPVGSVDAEVAMRAVDRLPAMLDTLAEAYDVVVVECGAVDAAGLLRLTGKGSEIFVSVMEPDELVAEAADALVSEGYERLTLVTPTGFLPD